MSITLLENQTIRKDFQLVSAGIQIWIVTVEEHTEIPVPGVKVYLDAQLIGTTNTNGALGPFAVSSGAHVLLCTKEGYRDTRWSINVTFPSKYIVDMERISLPSQHKYSVVVFYCHLPGEARSDWEEWSRWLVSYETELMAQYAREQGISDAAMPVVEPIRELVVPGYQSGWGTVWQLAKDSPYYNDGEIRILFYEGEATIGCCAFPNGGTVIIRGSTVEQEVRAMNGEPRYIIYNMVYCEIGHEVGHLFGLDHCHGLTSCPMSQRQISYDDWIAQGKKLYFCDICRPTLISNWNNHIKL